jgi:hypothetical protein
MNVTINGYVSFTCNNCGAPHTVESPAFTFQEDVSAEAKGDEYIRYLSQIDSPCSTCNNKVFIKFDVWEFPTAVVNYSYYAALGANDIQCEFNVEHYFDNEEANEEDATNNVGIENENQNDEESDDDSDEVEKQFNETFEGDRYTDQYDDED